ncbi:MAG: hypothetical protein M1819_003795 [Sarea resinae]|nr:MAG: hypothetical protein M1819_003795 [Sarea resinae]
MSSHGSDFVQKQRRGPDACAIQRAVPTALIVTHIDSDGNISLFEHLLSNGLSPNETAWRSTRLRNVISSLRTYLERANITGLDLTSYLGSLNDSNAPIVGLSVSGGGSTSGLGGLGIWQAFDDRYPPAVAAGTGGIVQILSYLTGLSGGGGYTVVPLASNNFSTVADLLTKGNYTANYETGPTGNSTSYFEGIFEELGSKAEEGFTISTGDVLGRFFSNFLAPEWRYRDFSNIATFANHSFALGLGPMPIVTLVEVINGSSSSYDGVLYPGSNSSILNHLSNYELSPFEFGNWIGGRAEGFMPTQYIGTTMLNGSVANISECVTGFDKMSFVQGSTSDAFNIYLITNFSNSSLELFAKRDDPAWSPLEKRKTSSSAAAPTSPQPISFGGISVPSGDENSGYLELVEQIASNFNQTVEESLWATYPNPFLDYSKAMSGVEDLTLVDGSESGQTIPFWPLLQPARKVDFIIAFDGSQDGTDGWNNGTNLIGMFK